MKMNKAEEFLKEKGVSLHSVRATRLPHKYKNEELELIPLMEQFGEKCFMAGWEAKDKGMFSSDPSKARPEPAFKNYLDE